MRKGFTLLELIIVVIILGILVSIAMPQFFRTRLRAYSAEAYNILGTYRAAQLRYYEASGGNYTDNCDDLDVDITSPNYHNAPTCSSIDPIVSIAGNKGNYTLQIKADGTILCSGTDCSAIGQ
jgi:prepilin-type N-terminal cleavage/methylation domain-containing protein